MLSALLNFFSTQHLRRFMRQARKRVLEINALEPTMQALSDEELRAQTQRFKDRLAQGETLDALLVEAFATVREASWRVLKKRHFDVQLLGGMVLHKGAIAEMKTGEGKTLVATLPLYLNALVGKGAYLVTVNDYLAQRDAHEMGELYSFLGLTTGCILSGGSLSDEEKRAAYRADITYGTNNEFGFDYLRDNMGTYVDSNETRETPALFEEKIQRPPFYAIVDEVDSILIDEARTPLIISGSSDEASEVYIKANEIVLRLEPEDYERDDKSKSISFKESGLEKIEVFAKEAELVEGVSLFAAENLSVVHHLNQALKAQYMFRKDVDYMVRNNKILIIDEFTGRAMEGRRYSEGLHQALEAKEGVNIERESQTLASVTFQNYFRTFPKLAAMTGTAMTEAAEFLEIYNLDVHTVPTYRPVRRLDSNDQVYRTLNEKVRAVVALVKACHEKGQPVLVGTISVEKSELFSEAFTKAGIPHHVLNARQNEREANIIAEAGSPGSVIVATNMAGRGTDIQLGGNLSFRLAESLKALENPEENEEEAEQKQTKIEALVKNITEDFEKKAELVKAAGGLYVVGTERHESRRIDDQLRGRSARLGDPGAAQFFLCLEDDLMRILGSERLNAWLLRLGIKEDEVITHPWVNRAIAQAQKKVEAYNFDMRKHVLKYDDVMNEQRKIIYAHRQCVLSDPWEAQTLEAVESVVERAIETHAGDRSVDLDTLERILDTLKGFLEETPLEVDAFKDHEKSADLAQSLTHAIAQRLGYLTHEPIDEEKEKRHRRNALRLLDHLWKEHLQKLDRLRQGIHLISYGQKDPLVEYKRLAFVLFESLVFRWQEQLLTRLSRTSDDADSSEESGSFTQRFESMMAEFMARFEAMKASETSETPTEEIETEDETDTLSEENLTLEAPSQIRRMAPCPCGSEKMYKKCCGALRESV